jgi:hypothetical protein
MAAGLSPEKVREMEENFLISSHLKAILSHSLRRARLFE